MAKTKNGNINWDATEKKAYWDEVEYLKQSYIEAANMRDSGIKNRDIDLEQIGDCTAIDRALKLGNLLKSRGFTTDDIDWGTK